ncbi:MAG: adenosylcobalamin-dependent ribonucleoside-diphosphate reductase [Candidatus Thalassarchaeum sp.]|nr:adenosylcobalamin-dependent ribonucleoside-diphosphate reductase [Candidatus Thalassarchaeum sp.]
MTQSKMKQNAAAGEGEQGMVIERRFTQVDKDPFDQFDWITFDFTINNPDGSIAFEIENVALPSGYEGVPGKICAQKYMRKAGVPMAIRKVPEDGVPSWLQRSVPDEEKLQKMDADDRYGCESDGRQLFRRLAGTWTYWGWKSGYFASEGDARAYYDEMVFLIASQRSAPNSPQWFNTGLHWAYGIEGPAQGHWYVDPVTEKDMRSENAYEHPQPHACFIQSVSDSLVGDTSSIMGLWNREALLFKFGSGTGSNFSNIRGAGEPLSGGGTSSGLLSFLKIGDRAAGAIKSGGTTRRAAKMVTLDLDHPDIEEYIGWKLTEEEKVSALVAGTAALQKHCNAVMDACWDGDELSMDPEENPQLKSAMVKAVRASVPSTHVQRMLDLAKQGWKSVEFQAMDTDWQGEGYATVSGQNSNNSVRVPESFMEAVKDGGDWDLYFRTEKDKAALEGRDPMPHRTLDAKKLWGDIAYTAWACADPGVQFDTTINEWHTCPEGGRINGSNPCSEYMFLDDTACNLASINLLHYYDMDSQTFDVEGFRHSCRLWTTTLEISVLMAQFPSQAISRKSYDYRTLGLGFCNIGSVLMHMGIPYNDPRGYAICGAISAIMTGESYATSADLASFLGPFSKYNENSEHMLRVMRNHRRAAYNMADEEYENLSIAPMGIDPKKCPKDLLEAARGVWDHALAMGEEHGYRNAQTTVIAPTGTIGLVMAADTTGVEPQFSLVQFKNLAGGGSLRIINRGVPAALTRLGYSKVEVQEIVDHVMGTGSLERCESVSLQRLLEMGFSDAEFSKIEGAIESVFDIRMLFAPTVLGEDFSMGTLNIDAEECDNPFFDTLGHLGFSATEIEDAQMHVFGHLSIEDAPHLKAEHLPVFDCATPGGKNGTRCIDWEAHVMMMAAAQPFISGAISKTINMPSDVSIEDVQAAYDLSHSTMNKACAVYRDGSKLSQPLMNNLVDMSGAEEEEEEEVVVTVKKAVKQVAEMLPLPNEQAAPLAEAFVHNYIATRQPLPAVRDSRTMKASVGGHTVYLTSSKYDDGRLGEIMITTSKEGAAWRSLLNQFAIAVSIGLQYGVPLDAFVKSFTFQKFEPSGMVQGGSKRVKMAPRLVDYIFRELAIDYLGRNDLAHVSEEDLEVTSISRPEITDDGVARSQGESRNVQMTLDVDPETEMRQMAREAGFTGDICDECGGSQMVRNGTCLKCNSCGSTTGCA